MKNALPKAILSLLLFYGTGAVLWLMLLPPDRLIDLLEGLPFYLRPMHLPAHGSINILQTKEVQKAFFRAWSLPVLGAWLGAVVTGCVLAATGVMLFMRHRKHRAKPIGEWRTLSISLGNMPLPAQLPRKPMHIKLRGLKMSKAETKLLNEILGTLAAHPRAYVGAGHGDTTLLQHTMGVIDRILKKADASADHVLAAAAHDIGKITSFAPLADGSWGRVKMHAQESARILALLPAWSELPEDQREAVRLAVKNEHSPNQVPGIDARTPHTDLETTVVLAMQSEYRHPLYDNADFRKRVISLIEALREADGVQTAAEKKVVLEQISDLPEFCFNAFMRALPLMPFWHKGAPAGFKAMIWQKAFASHHRFYISEAKMREFVMNRELTEEHRAALGADYRGPGTIAPFTWNLIEAFRKRSWLVTKSKCYSHFTDGSQPTVMECEPNMPLWDVLSGTLVLNGMIILEVPCDAEGNKFIERSANKELGQAIGAHRPHVAGRAKGGGKKAERPTEKLTLVSDEDVARLARESEPSPAMTVIPVIEAAAEAAAASEAPESPAEPPAAPDASTGGKLAAKEAARAAVRQAAKPQPEAAPRNPKPKAKPKAQHDDSMSDYFN